MNPGPQTVTFLESIQQHKGIIYKIAFSYCQNAEDRKDLVQEIIIRLWRSFDKYSDQYQYSTWVYRISLNTAISFYRKENRWKKVTDKLPEDSMLIDDTAGNTATEVQLGLLQQFLAQLRELDKALMLLYLEEKTYREIAEIVGITETNVATRISRIKKQLYQKFSNEKI